MSSSIVGPVSFRCLSNLRFDFCQGVTFFPGFANLYGLVLGV